MVESTTTEDLNCPVKITSITPVENWENRFVEFNYSDEQKRIVNASLAKLKEWFTMNEASDWKNEKDKNGIKIDGKKSERGLSSLKVTCNMAFNLEDIFLVLCAGELR